MAGLARAAQLSFVVVPNERDEAMRDLSRVRIDAVCARLKRGVYRVCHEHGDESVELCRRWG
jgi:hypothetical protein